MADDVSSRVKLHGLDVLSDNHYVLRNARFEFRRRGGEWQAQKRESYDMGDGAAVLPIDRARGTVLLVRQFRWPVFEAGRRELLIEAPAGKLDGDDPQTCVTREAMEEAGIAVSNLQRVTKCFSSPGAVTEQLSLYVADYDSAAPRGKGGGHESEGEDIETLEIPLDDAMAMIVQGEIVDAKTIILLQAAKLRSTP